MGRHSVISVDEQTHGASEQFCAVHGSSFVLHPRSSRAQVFSDISTKRRMKGMASPAEDRPIFGHCNTVMSLESHVSDSC